jgi:hypothetical protein
MVLPLDMVDNLIRPLRTHFGLVFSSFNLPGKPVLTTWNIGSQTSKSWVQFPKQFHVFHWRKEHEADGNGEIFERMLQVASTPGAPKTLWSMVSASHAGCLADHQTPVGFVDI